MQKVEETLQRIARDGVVAFMGDHSDSLPVSPLFAVSDDEGKELIRILQSCKPVKIPLPEELVPESVSIVAFEATDKSGEVGAYVGESCVGVYAGACLYVLEEYRGRGVGKALCIGAGVARGGTVTGDWGMHGYTESGFRAHEKAWIAVDSWAADLCPSISP